MNSEIMTLAIWPALGLRRYVQPGSERMHVQRARIGDAIVFGDHEPEPFQWRVSGNKTYTDVD